MKMLVAKIAGLGRWTKLGDTFKRGGEKLRAMGDAMKPVSTVLTAGFALSTKKAIDFESQMNTTKSLLADTIPTADELNSTTQKLGESSKGWAKQYGISTSSINEGMQEIIRKKTDSCRRFLDRHAQRVSYRTYILIASPISEKPADVLLAT